MKLSQKRCIRCLLTGIFCLLFSKLTTSVEIYRWVDDKGQVHYGDRSREERAVQIELPEHPPLYRDAGDQQERSKKQLRLLDMFQEQRETQSRERVKAQELRLQRDKRCRQAQDRLTRYQEATLYEPQADGSRRYLSEEEQNQAIAKARNEVLTWCATTR